MGVYPLAHLLFAPATPRGALIIYNDDRTVLTSMLPDAPGYRGLVDAIVSSGSVFKACFRATRAADGTLKISFGELLPDEKW